MTAVEGSAGGYIHATVVVIGERGVLIRGASGAGKSRLAALLLAEAKRRGTFARLVGDDRVALSTSAGKLLARPHPTLAGLIERRFEGVLPVHHEPVCVVDRVIDLCDDAPPRLPDASERSVELLGVAISCLRRHAGFSDLDAASLLDCLESTDRSGRALRTEITPG